MQGLLDQLSDDLKSETASLPSMPAVALQIRRVVEDPKATAERISRAVYADPVIAARLLRVANGVLYSPGGRQVTDVATAVVRLGGTVVRDLVTCVVVEQLFQQSTARGLGPHLRRLWEHSVRVACFAYVLARRARLPAQSALLAGLLHDIGRLYLLTMAYRKEPALLEAAELPVFLERQHAIVGAKILRHWGMDEALIAVAREHENLRRDPPGPPDLVDAVLLANLHSYLGQADNPYRIPFVEIPAFRRLGLDPEGSIAVLKEAAGEIGELRALLGAGRA